MKTKKYNIFHLPLLSFFSKRLYRDVGRNWKGANFSYLFLLLAICWIPPTLSMRHDLMQTLEGNQLKIINQIPDIQIKNGTVRVDQQEPQYITHKGETIAIIDTTGSMNYIDDPDVRALLTADKLVIRRGENEFNTLDLSKVTDFHINKEIAQQWIAMTKNSLAPISYGLFLLTSYISIILFMIVAAIVGQIFSAIIHSTIKFAGTLRITAVAATPSIIILAASIALKQPITELVLVAVTMIYLLIGIICCKKPEEEHIPQLKLTEVLNDKADSQKSHAA